MRKAACEQCGGQFAMNETLRVYGATLCENCARQSLEGKKDIQPQDIERQVDPTVCCNCGADNLETALPILAGLPVCARCEQFFRNRPFPAWVKAALAGIVALVAFSLVWNMRFIRAYYELRTFGAAVAARDIEKATARIVSASQRVPESRQLWTYASFYRGILLLNQDKSAEALELLRSCRADVPPEMQIDELIVRAEIGVAFDNKDYDRFLKLALQMSAQNPDDSIYSGQVASAYACKYAVTGEERFKTEALTALDKARKRAERDAQIKEYFDEYEERILHRLHSREVINREQFKRRFPNGWKREGKGQP